MIVRYEGLFLVPDHCWTARLSVMASQSIRPYPTGRFRFCAWFLALNEATIGIGERQDRLDPTWKATFERLLDGADPKENDSWPRRASALPRKDLRRKTQRFGIVAGAASPARSEKTKRLSDPH
jgi:hypothetical protein